MKRLLVVLLSAGGILLLLGVTAAALLWLWATRDLPTLQNLTDYNPPLVTTVHTRQGEVMGYFYREKRFLVNLADCPLHLPRAFLAAEDASFYQHPGVDPSAIFRAFIKNLMAGEMRQGGSTITQQVIKQLVLSPEKSFERKIKEAIIAYRVEKYLSKDDLLSIYLNHIYLGSGAYGVEAAARVYFAKHVAELTLAESAVLAGLPKAPSSNDPHVNPEKAKERQRYVLQQLRELDWITEEEFQAALAEPLRYARMEDPSWKTGAYYLEEIRRWLVSQLSEKNAAAMGLDLPRHGEDAVYELGLQVIAGMDMDHQRAAELALRRGLEASAKRRGWQGPVEHLEAAAHQPFLDRQEIDPAELVHGHWLKALVTKVDKNGAVLRVGPWNGSMAVKTMAWARKINPAVAPENAPAIKDATQVLKPGDVVWASVVDPRIPEKKPDPNVDEPAIAPKGLSPVDPAKGLTLALEQRPQVQGALVSLEPGNGEVRALVGGYQFEDSHFNRATQGYRQPGSTFKPIVYSAALDGGFTPASIVMDSPAEYRFGNQVWRPANFEGKFFGPTLVRTALVKSRNMVTIRMAERIGIDAVVKRAKALGLEPEFPRNLAVSLGAVAVSPVNLAQAYTAFARGDGQTIAPRLVLAVRDAWGRNLMTPKPVTKQAISPENGYLIASILKDAVSQGTGWRARQLQRPVAGKTGTANNEQDAWFAGFTPYLLTVVWVGFDQVQPMGKLETGGRAAVPIFVSYRRAVEEKYPVMDFPQPQGIVTVAVDPATGQPVDPSWPGALVLPFEAGTEPAGEFEDEPTLAEGLHAPYDEAFHDDTGDGLPVEGATPDGAPRPQPRQPKASGEELFKQF